MDTPGGVNEPLDLKPIDPFERAKRGETTQTVETTTKSLFQELVDGTKPIPKVNFLSCELNHHRFDSSSFVVIISFM